MESMKMFKIKIAIIRLSLKTIKWGITGKEF
jgi:hypothetical protein